MRVRNFRLFFIGQIVSQVGTWTQQIAIVLLVLELTDSGIAAGAVTATLSAPTLLFGAWGGLVSDRYDRHATLLKCCVGGALVATLLALAAAPAEVHLWMIYMLAFAAGTVNAIENAPRRAFVGDLVQRDEITNAVGLNSTLMTTAGVIGPALAGALLAGPGVTWCFAANAASFIPQFWCFKRIDRAKLVVAMRVDRARGQIRAGLAYAWAERDLRYTMIMSAAVGTFYLSLAVYLPLLITRDLGESTTAFTLMYTIMTAGSLVGALMLARRSTITIAVLALGTTVVGATLMLLAATPTLWTTALIVTPLGAAHIAVVSGSNTLVQLGAEPHMRGRVLALMSVVFMGSRPFGALLTGPISEVYSARLAALLGGIVCLATGGLILRSALSPAGARRELPVLPLTDAVLAELPDQRGMCAEASTMVDTATLKCRNYE